MDDFFTLDQLPRFPQTIDCNGVEITFYSKSVQFDGKNLYLGETPTLRTVAFFEALVLASREAVARDVRRALNL